LRPNTRILRMCGNGWASDRSPTSSPSLDCRPRPPTLQPPVLGLALASHQDPRAARWVGQQVPGLKVWVWPATVNPSGEDGLVQWFDALLADLTREKP
jgi:hypothetical protein